jgi:hypothetical protein
MTAASGAKCIGGVFLYTDRNVIASDGAATQGCKIYHRNLVDGSIALASATDDAIAAQGLADQLLDEVVAEDCRTIQETTECVRRTIVNWSNPYSPEELGATQFLMAVGTGGGSYLYIVQPRNTVTEVRHNQAIGAGARVVERLLPSLFCEGLMYEPRTALFMLAYATKHAKMEEAFVGNQPGSDAIFVRPGSRAVIVPSTELYLAEELVFSPDAVINDLRRFLLALESPEVIERNANELRRMIASTAHNLREAIVFPSLVSTADREP